MMEALERVEVTALVVTNYENAQAVQGTQKCWRRGIRPRCKWIKAGQRVKAIVEAAGADDQILLLLSGGGSALLPCPIEGITLEDKQATNDLMLGGGLPIEQINLVRQKSLSAQGQGLGPFGAPAKVRTLILSDVIGDDVRAIASGPTAQRLGDRAAAKRMLQAAGLWAALPTAVRQVLSRQRLSLPIDTLNQLIGSNAIALHAMAKASGGEILSKTLIGDVEETAKQIALI